MKIERLIELRDFFYNQLVNDTLPFWMNHCRDDEYGGYLTYITKTGERCHVEKNGWVHARTIWMYSRCYNELEQRQEWLDFAAHGVDFLKKNFISEHGRMMFTVTAEGKPVRQRRYLFTETFGVIALAEYYRASGDQSSLELAKKILDYILAAAKFPGMLPEKYDSSIFKVQGHGFPMIMVNTLGILRNADPENSAYYTELIDGYMNDLFKYVIKPERELIFETVGKDGELCLYSPLGRSINPGHGIETAWFLMKEGEFRNDSDLIIKAAPMVLWGLNAGWDEEFGGIYNFVDSEGFPAEQIEAEMKYWWPHNEALIGTLLAYKHTGDERYIDWFEKVFEWTHKHFPDKEHGEWFGYLYRDGSVAMPLKGDNWKGPFHMPRQQLYCYQILQELIEINS